MPLAPLAAAFATGIALAPWIAARPAWALGIAACALTTLVLAAGRPSYATAPLLAAIVALGAVRAMPLPLPADHVARLGLPAAAHVEGRLADAPVAWAPDRSRLVLDVERVDDAARSGRIALAVYGETPLVSEGQRVAVDARLYRPVGFQNPGGFDSVARLARDGIHVTGSGEASGLAGEPAGGVGSRVGGGTASPPGAAGPMGAQDVAKRESPSRTTVTRLVNSEPLNNAATPHTIDHS